MIDNNPTCWHPCWSGDVTALREATPWDPPECEVLRLDGSGLASIVTPTAMPRSAWRELASVLAEAVADNRAKAVCVVFATECATLTGYDGFVETLHRLQNRKPLAAHIEAAGGAALLAALSFPRTFADLAAPIGPLNASYPELSIDERIGYPSVSTWERMMLDDLRKLRPRLSPSGADWVCRSGVVGATSQGVLIERATAGVWETFDFLGGELQ